MPGTVRPTSPRTETTRGRPPSTLLYNPPMDREDPFELLGLPRRFDLDRQELQAAYLKRAALLHPDRFTDPIEQSEAAEKAARLNDARALLADDEKRANALLELLGGPRKEEYKTLPDGFLMEMMEQRQEMEESLASGDPEQRKRIEDWAAQRRVSHLERVETLFDDAGESPSQETLQEIRTELHVWRYIERMIKELSE